MTRKFCSFFRLLIELLALIKPSHQATITEMWTRIPTNYLSPWEAPTNNLKLPLLTTTALSLIPSHPSKTLTGVKCGSVTISCEEILPGLSDFKMSLHNIQTRDPFHVVKDNHASNVKVFIPSRNVLI
ncbi:hypothetical protein TCAL_04804 [Tigriopus californicus]|uniref:Uncharacterized protein n=2 Tax=Tigriopus californicus TaxID=6832 RepID=A0A553PRX5_TIGCA|nr:hypothetical protein TCAL_04804 [Tigriopus californicus]|eukprot:TCALIF_04804-PA protein Name:"Protein of unknown function" AED:0.00 eAED:0.00 QI:12/1/1/1/0/0.33/3/137/127